MFIGRLMKVRKIVVLGDVVSSSNITLRERFQEDLYNACNKVNSEYGNDIYAQFKIIKGADEIGGVLDSTVNIYNIFDLYNTYLYPKKIRMVFVRDYIDTSVEGKDVSLMDGQAFHKASNLMNDLKKDQMLFNIFITGNNFDISIVNQVNLIQVIKNNWTPNQLNVFNQYKTFLNQKETAKEIHSTAQYISKTLKRINSSEIQKAENNINNILKSIQNEESE